MRIAPFVCAAGLLFNFGPSTALAQASTQPEIEIYTEDYKPLYYEDETGKIAGALADLMRDITEAAGIRTTIHIRPFKRGLNAVQNNKNYCFLSLWRTASREPNFSWVGPLEIDGFALFALKDSNIALTSVEDSFRYPTGAVGGWTSTMELERAGHPNLVLVSEDELNANMLEKGHTKLWLGGLISSPFVARQLGIEIKNVLTVQEVDLALACNLETDRDLLDRLQTALDSYRKQVPLANPKSLIQ